MHGHGVTEVQGHPLGPSPHLRWEELGCRDGTPYPLDFREDGRLAVLCEEFEALRAVCGPLLVNSAYRTAAYNRRVGGAPSSQHLAGRALDLVPVRCDLDTLWAAILERARVGQVRGAGRYRHFCHVDIRPGDGLVVWDNR